MLFNSLDFVLFFLIVYPVYLALRFRQQNALLLVASYFFYGYWDWRFLVLLWITTVFDYVLGIGIHAASNPARRRLYLVLSLIGNLGILGFFKYLGFFADSFGRMLLAFGFQADFPTLHIVLPVGISFYTFQSMSYTIDIYRGQLKPTRNFLDYALFVVFFPQLVAGPIERATHLLGQVMSPRTISYAMIREGSWLVLLGYFKKVVVADNLAPFVDEIFNNPAQSHGLSILVAVVAFAFQIYGDFSGYSDIARGISKWMGFDILLNFRMPYFATNPADFWRRWHISLSTWLRDYLYIPLGGNRNGRLQTYRNLSLTMLLGGLWHGASWHFVAWGIYQGGLLIAHRLWMESFGGDRSIRGSSSGLIRWLKVPCFFVLICIGWMLFRVNHLGDIPILVANVFSPWAFNGKLGLLTLAVFAGPLLLIEVFQETSGDMQVVKRWPAVVRLAVYLSLFAAVLLAGAVEKREFIYFQF